MRRFCRISALIIIAAAAGLRFSHWGGAITTDEASMIHFYASKPLATVISSYGAPNNHVLLSVLMRSLDAVYPKKLLHTLADHRPLQLISILSSILTLFLLYGLARRLTNPQVALLSVAALGVSHWHLFYSHMLRGYGLSGLLVLGNAWILLRGLDLRAWLWALPFGMALAHLMIPANLFFSLVLAAWVFVAFRRDPRWEPAAKAYGVSLSAGFALTALVWWPALGGLISVAGEHQVSWGESLVSLPQRLGAWLAVVGLGRPFQVVFAAIAAGGLLWVWTKRRRWAPAALLIGASLAVPPVLFMLQRTLPPFRIYTVVLPIWAMAFGLGLYAVLPTLRRRLPAPCNGRRVLLLTLAALTWAVSSRQVGVFLERHRGIDPRRVMMRLSERTADKDDFSVIYTQMGRIPELKEELAWEYYGFAAQIEPHVRLMRMKDFPYLARGRYYVLADGEVSARKALEESGVDALLAAGMKEIDSVGDVHIFEAAMDGPVLQGYRDALESDAPSPLKASALAGLAYSAMAEGDLSRAESFLEKSLALSPSERTRHSLGMVRYRAFEDEAAARTLVPLTTSGDNVHAPFYLADSLAGRGRPAEARRWYSWYTKPMPPAGVWFLIERAKRGMAALGRGEGTAARNPKSPSEWEAAAVAYYGKGAFERAALAMAKAGGGAVVLGNLAAIHHANHDYAQAVAALRRAAALDPGQTYKLALARELLMKRRFSEASRLTGAILMAEPENAQARMLSKKLKRF